jgi:2-oxoglutarate dehydrogenase complex dehydrogenase (E1) component-like enzyme
VLPPEPEDRPVNHEAVPTAVTAETVKRIIDTQVNLPADFTPHPRLKPLLDRRAAMTRATYRIPHLGAAGMAANTLLHLAGKTLPTAESQNLQAVA